MNNTFSAPQSLIANLNIYESHSGFWATSKYFKQDNILERMKEDMTLFESYRRNFYRNACKQNNWKISKFVIDYVNSKNYEFEEFYITEITDSRMLNYVMETYSKKFSNIEDHIFDLMNNSFYEGYNDIIDYILINNLIKNAKATFLFMHVLKDVNSFRKIYSRFPNFLSEIKDWELCCSFEVAKELRFIGCLRKLDIANFYYNNNKNREFIRDCSYEMGLGDFLNSEFFSNGFENSVLFVNLYYLTEPNFVVEKSKFDKVLSFLEDSSELVPKITELNKRYM